MARKFLYIIAGIVVLVLLVLTSLRLFGLQLSRIAFVPGSAFQSAPALNRAAYQKAEMWIARPDKVGNPALWRPTGEATPKLPNVAIFFIHPTSYFDRARWNAPLTDKDANDRAAQFVRNEASAFNASGTIWAPRYRQATFGTFLTDKPARDQALNLAYRDVAAAFDAFVAAQPKDRPLLLAGHSQGALMLMRLLQDHASDKALMRRIIAAYAIGWPVSQRADLPALGLPACAGPDQTGCVLSWQSFAEPADYAGLARSTDAQPGLTGKPRGDAYVCTNPLTGGGAKTAKIADNLGTLLSGPGLDAPRLGPGLVGARCDAKGYLLIGNPPEMGPFVLPGNNYHIYDYSLFWANIRADAARRVAAFSQQ